MSHNDKIKIFSSHRWAYNNHRQGLHNLLAPWVKNVDFVDFSIPKTHPVSVEDDIELATEIRDRIRDTDVLLVFAGMYVNGSEWVKFEIHSAFSDCCPIIAVVPNGQERLPRTATKFAAREVHWRSESIRGAILELLPEARKQEIQMARKARIAAWARTELAGQSSFFKTMGVAPPPAPPSASSVRNALSELLSLPPTPPPLPRLGSIRPPRK